MDNEFEQMMMSKYVNALATAQQQIFQLQTQNEILSRQNQELTAANDAANEPVQADEAE